MNTLVLMIMDAKDLDNETMFKRHANLEQPWACLTHPTSFRRENNAKNDIL